MRVATLNVGSMTVRSVEILDMLERRETDESFRKKRIRMVQDMNKNSKTRVSTSAGVSQSSEETEGVH